jgi:hypothetical protein
MAHYRELSFVASLGGNSQKLALSTSSAQSATLGAGSTGTMTVLFTTDVDCFYRQGSNPVAVSDGTDQLIVSECTYRVQVLCGNKLAFVTASGTGNAYITPEV